MNKTKNKLPGGVGNVQKAGQHIADVSYQLVGIQDKFSGGFGDKQEGKGQSVISGQITILKGEKLDPGEIYSLHFEDNGHFEFIVKQSDRANGIYQITQCGSKGFIPG